jgi:hypothetical protein
MKKHMELAALRDRPRGYPLLWQSAQSRLYSAAKLTIPVNKFWLTPDSWLAVARRARN